MTKMKICAAFLLSVGCSVVVAQRSPDADQVLAHVNAQAGEEHKNVLLVFGVFLVQVLQAVRVFLSAPEIQPIIAKHFVVARLGSVRGVGRNPKLNNPKSDTLVRQFGDADKGGLPFIVFLDRKVDLLLTRIDPANGKNGREHWLSLSSRKRSTGSWS